MTAVVMHVVHSAEEDHFQRTEQQEDEKDGETKGTREEAKVMTIHHRVAVAISIPKFVVGHHGWHVDWLAIFSSL